MKAILLNTPVTNNAGARCDAGQELLIGDGDEEITLARAEALVTAFSAVDVVPSVAAAPLPETTAPVEKPAKKGD